MHRVLGLALTHIFLQHPLGQITPIAYTHIWAKFAAKPHLFHLIYTPDGQENLHSYCVW